MLSDEEERHRVFEDFEQDLLSHLECPVCLTVPRGGPIPSCPAGHIVCLTCRESLDTCPTCRRPLSVENTNSLASALIDKVKHKCKYHVQGCDVRRLLGEILYHEEICPERTIVCPNLRCLEEVKLKSYQSHVTEDDCLTGYRLFSDCDVRMQETIDITTQFIKIVDPHIIEYNLTSRERHSRLRRAISFKRFEYNQKQYFLHYYITQDDQITLFLMFAGNREDSTDSNVKFTLKSKDREIQTTYCTKIILIDEAPITEEDLMSKREVWCLSKQAWSKLLHRKRISYPNQRVSNGFDLFISIYWFKINWILWVE